jgi:hypothetical protein
VLSVTGALSAQEGARRVVLLNADAGLERAARAALQPWHVEVSSLSGAWPGSTVPEANARAKALALSAHATALVWVSIEAGGGALWLYDRESERLIERPLATLPPFDPAAAAAVALSIKTLLRHSTAAPAEERYGATAHNEPPMPPRAESERNASERPVVLLAAADTAAARSLSATTGASHAPSWLDLAGEAGLLVRFTRVDALFWRVGARAVWWPKAGWLGVGISALAGPSARVRSSVFDGSLNLFSPSLSLHGRWLSLERLTLSAAARLSLHVLSLRGEPLPRAARVDLTRLAPALALALRAEWALTPSWFVAAEIDAGLLPRTERYFARERLALELSRAHFGGSLSAGFRLR